MLEVRLLGRFEALRDGVRLTIPSRNAQTLFAYLVIHAGKAHRREKLAGLLWPDSSEENARGNLRHELWRLRKSLETEGESNFLVDDLTIAFQPQNEVSLDVRRLEKTPLEGSTTGDLIEALSAYQGELLPGFYEDWVIVERERLQMLFETKIAHLLEILQTERRWADVLDWGMRWISVGQWPEPACRALMTAYASAGDLAKAAGTYERFSRGMQKDLGVEPSEQTQALYKRIRSGWKIDAQPPARKTGHSTPSEAKSAQSFTLPKVRRSNLPNPLTSFIGREKEIQQVKKLLSQSGLVTLTGPGGVGKTRLAIQAAGAMTPQFRDGVWWVELAGLTIAAPHNKRDRSHQHSSANRRGSPDLSLERGGLEGVNLVALAVTTTLRIPESPGLSLLEGMLEYLQDKQILLLLDNCEHLIAACATLVEYVLSNCPEMIILATSREALRVPGEKAWLLPSLSLPKHGPSLQLRELLQYEAVRLFIERATDVIPGYQPGEADLPSIAQICQRLDGIPLAIELAAARINLLSAQEISARLDKRFSLLTGGYRTALPRHRTLRAAIEWSHVLLGEADRILFRRLSVFTGSFSLEAAEDVCTTEDIQNDGVLTLLGQLVDKSLLKVEPTQQDEDLATRYRFLDTIRSFSRLKLDEAEETGWMCCRHADYYVRLVEAAEPELLLQNQVHWFKLLQAENDNLRAVIDWSSETGQAESALRLVGVLLWYWFSFGSTREGRDLALKALTSPSGAQFKEARAKALNTAGFMLYLLGDSTLSRQSLEEALAIQNPIEDKDSLAWTLQFLGLALAYDQEYELADAAMEEGLALTRKLGGVHTNNFLHFLGDINMQKGDRSRAKKIYEESVNLLQAFGSKSFLAYPLRRLGYLALEQNDLPNAWNFMQGSLAVNLEIGDRRAVAACLTGMAALAIRQDKPVLAARLYGAVESRLDSLFIRMLPLDQAELRRIHSNLLTLLDEATLICAFTEGLEMSEDEMIKQVEESFRGLNA